MVTNLRGPVLSKEQALLALAAEARTLPSGFECLPCALIAEGQRPGDRIAESEHGVVVVNRFASSARR